VSSGVPKWTTEKGGLPGMVQHPCAGGNKPWGGVHDLHSILHRNGKGLVPHCAPRRLPGMVQSRVTLSDVNFRTIVRRNCCCVIARPGRHQQRQEPNRLRLRLSAPRQLFLLRRGGGVLLEYQRSVLQEPHPYTVKECLASLRAAYARPARGAWSSTSRLDRRPHSGRPRPGKEDERETPLPSSGPPETEDQQAHRTDRGNAIRLVKRRGNDHRFCHPWGKWLCWDGKGWQLDQTAAVMHEAKQTIVALFRQATDEMDEICKSMEGGPT